MQKNNKVNVLYGANKSAEQLKSQIESIPKEHNILITKVNKNKFNNICKVNKTVNDAENVINLKGWIYIKSCHAALLQHNRHVSKNGIRVVTAGKSDISIRDEVITTLLAYNYKPKIFTDIGVNNINRSLKHIKDINKGNVIISIQGFEGALPVILAGLTKLPIISIPTSTGYGLSKDGKVALNTSLTSCTPGIACVNINNGFGGAIMAMEIMKQVENATKKDSPKK